jgi:hypothetical protein
VAATQDAPCHGATGEGPAGRSGHRRGLMHGASECWCDGTAVRVGRRVAASAGGYVSTGPHGSVNFDRPAGSGFCGQERRSQFHAVAAGAGFTSRREPFVPKSRAYIGVDPQRIRLGHTLRAEADVEVDPALTVAQAHDVAHHAQRHLVGAVRRLTDATITSGPPAPTNRRPRPHPGPPHARDSLISLTGGRGS